MPGSLMKYFLVQPNNKLVRIGDFRHSPGIATSTIRHQIGGPSFHVPGRRQPGAATFTLPPNCKYDTSYQIVDELGNAWFVVGQTNLNSGAVAGVGEEERGKYTEDPEVMALIRDASNSA